MLHAGDPQLAGTLSVEAMTWTVDCGEFMVVATPQPAAPQMTLVWTVAEADRCAACPLCEMLPTETAPCAESAIAIASTKLTSGPAATTKYFAALADRVAHTA